jgi:multiple sugar transport system permease protein
MLDGCSRLGALWRVVVPLAAPGLLTAFLLAFVSAWDEFLFALSFTTGPAARTLPAGIALHGNLADVPWPEVAAGLALGIAPVAVLAVLFQERVVAGLATGGMRG